MIAEGTAEVRSRRRNVQGVVWTRRRGDHSPRSGKSVGYHAAICLMYFEVGGAIHVCQLTPSDGNSLNGMIGKTTLPDAASGGDIMFVALEPRRAPQTGGRIRSGR